MPPGRPKKWRERAMETLKQAVENRVNSDVYDTRETDKMWLVRHLEIVRKSMLEDLRVANSSVSPVSLQTITSSHSLSTGTIWPSPPMFKTSSRKALRATKSYPS